MLLFQKKIICQTLLVCIHFVSNVSKITFSTFFSLSFSKTYLDPEIEKSNYKAVSDDYQGKIMTYGPEDDVRSLPRPHKPRPVQHPYVRVAPPSYISSSTSTLGHPDDFFQGKMGDQPRPL